MQRVEGFFANIHYDTRMYEVRVVISKDRQGGNRRETKEGSNGGQKNRCCEEGPSSGWQLR